MRDYQIIQLNIGLNWTDGDKSGEFDRELGRFLVETKFPHTGIISEPYASIWTDKSGKTYRDNCLGFKISIPRLHAMPIGEIERRIETVRVILKQECIAFTTSLKTTGREYDYSDVYYGTERPDDALTFDPNFFHFVK